MFSHFVSVLIVISIFISTNLNFVSYSSIKDDTSKSKNALIHSKWYLTINYTSDHV